MCGVIIKSQGNTNPEKSTAGFMEPWEISIAYIHISASNEGAVPTRAARGSNELPRSGATGSVCASFLRLTSCRETRRICRERFWERGRYLVAETTVSYGRGVARTSLLAPEKVVCSHEKLSGSWSLAVKIYPPIYSPRIFLIVIFNYYCRMTLTFINKRHVFAICY